MGIIYIYIKKTIACIIYLKPKTSCVTGNGSIVQSKN